ncbi:MAG: Methyltransferase type 11 [Candidatus Woesebacteria bacterium GW2011_GWB1_38_5b]|uniref:Methyltransferase type 11 n=1 Tax=Candidatus Woesebacteria bacterium GW2011_GWB1_38_5b TaxID=1618569 RepID=A0A0G0K8F0_9BACT|nr:MAG: Methyltransferase type 11 [Candidatus Woesebacteria bacterium GW2011_GWB1_38_5b]
MDNKQIIKDVIFKLDKKVFQNSGSYSRKEKIFLEDRYSQVIDMLPKISKNNIGLEAGLHSSILAFSLKKILSLEKLYALEHPTTYRLYTKKHLNKLRENNIILKPVDLYQPKYPWPDNFFDFILFSEVMEHLIPAYLPHIFAEFNRIIKKNGYLIVTTPNIASLLKRLNLMSGKNPIEFDLRFHDKGTFGHIREYTMPELISILQNANFKILETKYYCIDSSRNIFTQIEANTSKFFHSLGNDMMVVATSQK